METETTELVRREDDISLGMVRGTTPGEMVRTATEVAKHVAAVVEDRKLYTNIGGKKHVQVTGWATMLALLGVVPREVTEKTRCLEDGSYVAEVELVRLSDQAIVGRASSECGMDEERWASRPAYARRGMAVTRATGRAARLGFSWLMELAGYAATPAEEMDGVMHNLANGTPAPSAVPCVPFGENKGKPVTELTDRELAWYLDRAQKKGEKNWEAALLEEKAARRLTGAAS
jgi:hypothetical protein